MSIAIVSHCWAADLPQYATFLKYQLSSLIRNKPKVPITYVICYSSYDMRTTSVLQWFMNESGFDVRLFELEPNSLGRRAIGRHIAATECKEDWIWFCDVDYFFGHGCLDSLWDQAKNLSGVGMVYPKTVQFHKTHELGDVLVENDSAISFFHPYVSSKDFKPKKYHRAIGGVQITNGRLAREIGYLPNGKWQVPTVDTNKMFHTREDVAYRKAVSKHGKIISIDIPNLYRLRHSKRAYQ